MSETQSAGNAWPEPPFYYKRYTADNVERLQQAKKQHSFPDTPISQPPDPDFLLASLEPPKIPTESYTIFEQRWQINEQLQSLQDLGVKQLFPTGPIDRVAELKKLNRVLIVQFFKLLDTLVENPEEYGRTIENISTIFINMHHILNDYRPHQARETLRLLMESQIAKKRQMAADLRSKSQAALRELEAFGKEIVGPLLGPDNQDPSDDMTLNADTASGEIDKKEKDNSRMAELHQNLVAMVDDIE
ncbi:MED7 protein-domain-containing protein [Dichotomocladium elegans]|nr:MED7 protein-domain-containing protein [Dichotomocladium elegans]